MNKNKSNEHNCFSKEKIKVITAALIVFYCNLGRSYFSSSSEKEFSFSLEEVICVRDWFLKLYHKFKDKHESTEKIKAFLFESDYRVAVIYAALNKCNENFERYKIFNLEKITQKDFHSILEIFKELFPELEKECC